ncbi:hypothetical protein, variant [Aphanomyces astaci]|nr:hypothetical protein, variant [Aphanomyces astaci]ETV70688.1 hypothetical protein, variant [Aphanomyces astaci]|eukprot:XP_009839751.1 hypothetical protein, variant [Aphanomyces astaci]
MTEALNDVKMEIDIDPEKLRNRRKKRDFLQRRDDVLKGVGAKAAELRRRLFNRRTIAKASIANLPMMQQAKKDALDVRLALVEHDVKTRMIDAHTHQHFDLAESVRYLSQNLQHSTRSVRDNTSTLDDLARRVEFMQHVNTNSAVFTQPPAVDKVMQEVVAKYTSFLPLEACATCGKVLATSALRAVHEPYCRGILARDLPPTMHRCVLCHRVVKADRMTHHVEQCQRDCDRKAIIWSKYDVKGQPPQPPTDLRVVQTSYSSISLAWNPPMFTAGLDLVDFQVQMHVLVVEKFQTLKHRQHERSFQPLLPHVSTSQWNARLRPVALHGCTIDHLPAKTTFGHLSVRCQTKNGWSAWSDPIHGDIVTKDPVPPTPPLFLSVGLITVDSIALSWLPPFDCGGEPVDEYVVSFSGLVQVQDGRDSIDLRAAELKAFTRRVKVARSDQNPPSNDLLGVEKDGAQVVCCTIDGLRSGQAYSRLRVCAVSASGLIGQESPELDPVRTLAHGKELQLLAELQEAINSPASYIDSSFYNGFVQRYDRKHYITLVADTIKLHHPALSHRVDAMLPVDSDSESESDSDASTASSMPSGDRENAAVMLLSPASSTPPKPTLCANSDDGMDQANQKRLDKQHVRRKQFQYRLHQLRTHVDTLEYNIQWADDRCIVLVSMIEAAERRIMDKQAELERARGFQGPAMDSLAMHGGLQRFYTPALITALEEELDIEKYYIVDTKADLRAVEDQKKADMGMLAVKKAQIAARVTALDAFEADCEFDQFKAAQTANVLLKFKSRQLSYVFDTWRRHGRRRRANRAVMFKALTRLVLVKVSSAWHRWRQCIDGLRDQDAIRKDVIIGKGGVDLKGAHLARTHLQSDLYSMLHECRQLTGTLAATTHTMSQNSRTRTNVFAKERQSQQLRGVFVESKVQMSLRDQGDAQLDIGDYDAAIKTYDSLLDNLHIVSVEYTLQASKSSRSSSSLVPHSLRSIQTQTSQVYNRLGRAYFLLKQYDRSANSFERASGIATMLGDPIEGGVAFRGLADCHVASRDWSTALDLYLKAAGMYEDVTDVGGEVAAWRGIALCYREMDAVDLAADATTKGDSLEYALDQTMEHMERTLAQLHARLVGVTVKMSVECTCERVGAIVPRLRQERLQCKVGIMDEQKVLDALDMMLDEKKALRAQAEADLETSERTDSGFVDSTVFLGVSTRYTLDDFKANVQKLINQLSVVQVALDRERANAAIRISNLHDRIQECEEELKAETGPLMRRVRGKDPLRCFRFNAINAMYKNVLGRASGGVDTAVASVGPSIVVYDFLTGVCMGQGVGDIGGDQRHLGAPLGHTKTIMSLCCFHAYVYSGSMDCTLLVWQLVQNVPVLRHRLTDFDAAVMAIAATTSFVVAGTADCCIMV